MACAFTPLMPNELVPALAAAAGADWMGRRWGTAQPAKLLAT